MAWIFLRDQSSRYSSWLLVLPSRPSWIINSEGERMTTDEQAIRDLVSTWMSATKAGDTETVLSLMSDDVVFMVPGGEPFGKEAFAAASNLMKGATFDG